MAKTQTIEIKEAVRGELRIPGEVVVFDLEPGSVDSATLHPAVLARLIADGTAVVTKKETAR